MCLPWGDHNRIRPPGIKTGNRSTPEIQQIHHARFWFRNPDQSIPVDQKAVLVVH
jgi:hypothetical protein